MGELKGKEGMRYADSSSVQDGNNNLLGPVFFLSPRIAPPTNYNQVFT